MRRIWSIALGVLIAVIIVGHVAFHVRNPTVHITDGAYGKEVHDCDTVR